jgi:Phage integrase family
VEAQTHHVLEHWRSGGKIVRIQKLSVEEIVPLRRVVDGVAALEIASRILRIVHTDLRTRVIHVVAAAVFQIAEKIMHATVGAEVLSAPSNWCRHCPCHHLAACVGLRRSEIFGLKWSDFNWLLRELFVQRSHAEGYEGETKTESSNAKVPLHPTIIEALLAWRQQSSFNADDDYVFASPLLDGKKPLNSNSVQRDYLRPKSVEAGLKPLGWHSLRHSYRTWLAELKTGPEVQRDLMRHSTVGRSLDGYGQGVPDLNREANYAVVNSLLAVNPLN